MADPPPMPAGAARCLGRVPGATVAGYGLLDWPRGTRVVIGGIQGLG